MSPSFEPLTAPAGLPDAPDRSDGSGTPESLARIALTPGGSSDGRGVIGRGLLDGAWWPRSRDLHRELPALIRALDPVWGRVTRVAVNPEHWPVIPKKVAVGGRMLHVGWFADEQDPHKLLLLSYRQARWDLLVIPPETPPAMAARLMAAAADPHNVRTASDLVAQENPGRAATAA
jgi:hypothetical protein